MLRPFRPVHSLASVARTRHFLAWCAMGLDALVKPRQESGTEIGPIIYQGMLCLYGLPCTAVSVVNAVVPISRMRDSVQLPTRSPLLNLSPHLRRSHGLSIFSLKSFVGLLIRGTLSAV